MAIDWLFPNVDATPLQWGTFGSGPDHSFRVSNGVGTPDDTDGITTTTVFNNDRLDCTSTVVVDADTVNSVSIRMRYKSSVGTGSNWVDVELWIGGSSQGTTRVGLINDTSWHNTVVPNTGWNNDWTAAQLNGAQIDVESIQTGKSAAFQFDISEIDIVINYDLDDQQSAHLVNAGMVNRGLVSKSGLIGCVGGILVGMRKRGCNFKKTKGGIFVAA